ncbi:MAG TPA: hypothetical protein P5568_14425 [Acidobacteriota bacterium]|nr:hypothetical protein [Acidobacteriota bacterium]
MQRRLRSGLITAVIMPAVLGWGEVLVLGCNDPCYTTTESVVSSGEELSSSRRGHLAVLQCSVGENVGLIVQTEWVSTCWSDQTYRRDALVQQWYNWYPEVVTLSSGTSSATVFCNAPGNATIGVRVEEPHAWCRSGCECHYVTSGFPVVTVAVHVTE